MIHKILDQYVKACRRKVGKLWRADGRTDGRRPGRTDGRTDGHHHTIIRPVWRRVYKNQLFCYFKSTDGLKKVHFPWVNWLRKLDVPCILVYKKVYVPCPFAPVPCFDKHWPVPKGLEIYEGHSVFLSLHCQSKNDNTDLRRIFYISPNTSPWRCAQNFNCFHRP